MITKDFFNECTRINNSDKSLGFGYSDIKNHPNKTLICIGHKHLGQTFFCTLTERKNKDKTMYDLSLLKNDEHSTEEYLSSYDDAAGIRRGLINVIKDMYPLEKSEKSKNYCYPRDNIDER